MKLKFFIFIFILSFLNSIFCVDKGDSKRSQDTKQSQEISSLDVEESETLIWVLPNDTKEPRSILLKIAKLSDMLTPMIEANPEISELDPIPLLRITSEQFHLFNSIGNFLLVAQNAQQANNNELVDQQFNLVLDALKYINDPNIVHNVFAVSSYMDIPILKEFIVKNLAKICLLNNDCLDVLLKNIKGSLIDISGTEESVFKEQLALQFFYIKKQKELLKSEQEYNILIRNKYKQTLEKIVSDNLKIELSMDRNTPIKYNLLKIMKQNDLGEWLTESAWNVEDTFNFALHPDKKTFAAGKHKLIQFWSLKIDGTHPSLSSIAKTGNKENIDFLNIDYSPILIAFNNNGTELAVFGEYFDKENKNYFKIFIYRNINGTWKLIKEIPLLIPIKTFKSLFINLKWNSERDSLIIQFLVEESKSNNMVKLNYGVYEIFLNKIPDEIFKKTFDKLSINKLILILVILELYKTPEGQAVLAKNQDAIRQAIETYPENIKSMF